MADVFITISKPLDLIESIILINLIYTDKY